MKNHAIGLLVFILLVIFTSGLLIYTGLIPPSMPQNLEELKDWDKHRTGLLYKRTLECWEVPDYRPAENIKITEWRNLCNVIRKIWVQKMEDEKIKQAEEKIKDIFK